MQEGPSTVVIPETIEDQTTSTGDGLEARVTVFNCSCHTYQQVIILFCEVIPGMDPARAFELAWQIDHRGSAVVYAGGYKTAEDIATRLASGGLKVAVQ
jgi:ATP-dependent Clp protease adaptor protein ClpS